MSSVPAASNPPVLSSSTETRQFGDWGGSGVAARLIPGCSRLLFAISGLWKTPPQPRSIVPFSPCLTVTNKGHCYFNGCVSTCFFTSLRLELLFSRFYRVTCDLAVTRMALLRRILRTETLAAGVRLTSSGSGGGCLYLIFKSPHSSGGRCSR